MADRNWLDLALLWIFFMSIVIIVYAFSLIMSQKNKKLFMEQADRLPEELLESE